MRILFIFLEFLVALTLITQVLIPSFTPDLEFFWIFKRQTKPSVSSLDELEQEVDVKSKEWLSTKAKVNEADIKIKSLKSKTK
jgi:hypothetical protein